MVMNTVGSIMKPGIWKDNFFDSSGSQENCVRVDENMYLYTTARKVDTEKHYNEDEKIYQSLHNAHHSISCFFINSLKATKNYLLVLDLNFPHLLWRVIVFL